MRPIFIGSGHCKLWCWLIVAAYHITQEAPSRQRSQDTELVLGPDIAIEQANAAQALDALPASVLQLLVVSVLVLVAEQQDVEISAQQAAAHSG